MSRCAARGVAVVPTRACRLLDLIDLEAGSDAALPDPLAAMVEGDAVKKRTWTGHARFSEAGVEE